MLHQPPECPLDYPPARKDMKPLLRTAWHPLDVDTESRTVTEHGVLVAAVDPDPADRRMLGGQRAQQALPAAESDTDAAVTTTASRSPRVSVAMCRFRPLIFFAASMPCSDSFTLQDVLTL